LHDQIWTFDISSLSWTKLSFQMPYEIGDANKAIFINNHFYVTPGFTTGNNNGWGSHNKLIDINLAGGTAIETNSFPYGSIWMMISCMANSNLL